MSDCAAAGNSISTQQPHDVTEETATTNSTSPTNTTTTTTTSNTVEQGSDSGEISVACSAVVAAIKEEPQENLSEIASDEVAQISTDTTTEGAIGIGTTTTTTTTILTRTGTVTSDGETATSPTAEELSDLEHSQEHQINLNSSVTSMTSGRSNSRGFSAFPPIRLTRSIQNSNWRENLSNNLTSVIQEFRPVFQPHSSNNNNNSTANRGIIANLSNYRIPSNSSFRYIDSPASETNPPNYASDSFVINFDNNHVHNYRSTNRPSLTDSLRLEHNHDLHASSRSDGGADGDDRGFGSDGGNGGEGGDRPPPDRPNESNEQNQNHEHVEANLSDTIAQIPEAASLLDTLSRYVPYACILLAKSCYDHLDGILDFFALFVTFYHTNRVVRQEVTKQNQRSVWNLIRALLFIIAVVVIIGFMLDKKNTPIYILITGTLNEPFTLKNLMFAIGINDLIFKLFTVAIKIIITLIPPSFIDYKGRGRIYLMTEAVSQFLRSLVTTHPWLTFLLESYQGTEKIMGIILSGAYIVAKGSDLLHRLKFCRQALVKLLQKVCIGVIPTKEQIQQAGGLCTICHDNFNSPAMLDCGHIFCELCIGTWLDRATVCPLCRAKISDDPSFRDGSTTFFIQLY